MNEKDLEALKKSERYGQIDLFSTVRKIKFAVGAGLILAPTLIPRVGEWMFSPALYVLGVCGVLMLAGAIWVDAKENAMKQERLERALTNRRKKEAQEEAERQKRAKAEEKAEGIKERMEAR